MVRGSAQQDKVGSTHQVPSRSCECASINQEPVRRRERTSWADNPVFAIGRLVEKTIGAKGTGGM